MLVVPPSLSPRRLVHLAIVPATGLLTVQRVPAHALSEFYEVRDPAGVLESLVEVRAHQYAGRVDAAGRNLRKTVNRGQCALGYDHGHRYGLALNDQPSGNRRRGQIEAALAGRRYSSTRTNYSPTARLPMLRPVWTRALVRMRDAREINITPAHASGHRSDRRPS